MPLPRLVCVTLSRSPRRAPYGIRINPFDIFFHSSGGAVLPPRTAPPIFLHCPMQNLSCPPAGFALSPRDFHCPMRGICARPMRDLHCPMRDLHRPKGVALSPRDFHCPMGDLRSPHADLHRPKGVALALPFRQCFLPVRPSRGHNC